jgi:hypothetical protein
VDGVLWHHCRFCEHAAKQKGNIKKHEATHLGDRPFECQYCDDTFTQKTHLVNHERTHTGERPYGCDECGARFNRRFSLIIHEWTHAGIKPYLCSACDYAAVQSCSVTRHIKRRHPGSDAVYINATRVLEGPDNEGAVVNTAPAASAVTTAAAITLATVQEGKATTTAALLSERPAAKATGTDVAGAKVVPTAAGKGLHALARHRPPSRHRGDDSDDSNIDGSGSSSGSGSDSDDENPALTSDSEGRDADVSEDWMTTTAVVKATKMRARVSPHKQTSAGGGGSGGRAGGEAWVATTKRKGAFNKLTSACW